MDRNSYRSSSCPTTLLLAQWRTVHFTIIWTLGDKCGGYFVSNKLHCTVLSNGVKVVVWDFSPMFKMKKLFNKVVCIHIHIVRKWKWKAKNRASSNSTSKDFKELPDVKTWKKFFFYNWTSNIIPFICFGKQVDRT